MTVLCFGISSHSLRVVGQMVYRIHCSAFLDCEKKMKQIVYGNLGGKFIKLI